MKTIPFRKYHGFGNDYFVLMKDEINEVADLSEFTKTLCNRHTGAGSDGIALLEKISDGADYSCQIINPDGSEAGFSGNGTRCAAAFLYREKNWIRDKLSLRTSSGIKTFEYLRTDGINLWFEAEIGQPSFRTEDIPFTRNVRIDPRIEFSSEDLTYTEDGTRFPYLALNVGNPVCAIFVENFDPRWKAIGPIVENHPAFPKRTNVVFVKSVDESNIEIRIWERGAGETSSSGTCSIAAAVASTKLERTLHRVNVKAEGGTTQAYWREEDGEMLITGSAQFVYSGLWPVGQ